MGLCVGELGCVLGMNCEGSQQGELGWWWNEGGFRGRASVRYTLVESGVEEVEGRGIYRARGSYNKLVMNALLSASLLFVGEARRTVLFLEVDLAAQPQFAGQFERVAVRTGSFGAVLVVYSLPRATDIAYILGTV